jgi:hypothetical protein
MLAAYKFIRQSNADQPQATSLSNNGSYLPIFFTPAPRPGMFYST